MKNSIYLYLYLYNVLSILRYVSYAYVTNDLTM